MQEWFAKRKDDIQGLGNMSLTGLPPEKWGWGAQGCSSLVECMFIMHQALGLILSIAKKKKQKQARGLGITVPTTVMWQQAS